MLNSTCSCGVRTHNLVCFEQELTENAGVLQRQVDVFPTFWMFLIRQNHVTVTYVMQRVGGTLDTLSSLLEATLYQGNPDRNL